MQAFYFSTNEQKLRYNDNRPIVVGETHTIKGKPKCCGHGLHGSVLIIDALTYAPGSILYLVKLDGKLDTETDKIAASKRTYLAKFEASNVLRQFAKQQALININKIEQYCSNENYNIILDYLNGNRLAAWSARLAARSAAESAAESAAWSARSAAWSAWSARLAARLAARSAAESMLIDMIKKETNWNI